MASAAYKRNRAFIAEAKRVPCADCGQSYPPHVMDFDHVVGEKLFELGSMGGMSLQRIKVEIAKCEVVCANCHRHRTYTRRKNK